MTRFFAGARNGTSSWRCPPPSFKDGGTGVLLLGSEQSIRVPAAEDGVCTGAGIVLGWCERQISRLGGVLPFPPLCIISFGASYLTAPRPRKEGTMVLTACGLDPTMLAGLIPAFA